MSFFGSSPYGHSSSHRSSSHGTYFARPSAPRSNSSFFSRSGGSSSYYKRRPRDGYINYLVYKLKRLVLDLYYYARRHPVKAFFAVVVPLISAGGALHGLLKQFGIRLPAGFAGLDGGSRSYGGGGYYGSSGYGGSGYGSGYERGGGGGFDMGTVGSLIGIAKAFM